LKKKSDAKNITDLFEDIPEEYRNKLDNIEFTDPKDFIYYG